MRKTRIRRSPIAGRGVFADSDIGKGEFICRAKGKVVRREYRTKREIRGEQSYWPIALHRWIKPASPFRYLNHSCNPNAGFKTPRRMYARRDIKKEEEITVDYGTIDYVEFWEMRCRCDSRHCRKVIRSVQFLPTKIFAQYLPYIPRFLRKIYLQHHEKADVSQGRRQSQKAKMAIATGLACILVGSTDALGLDAKAELPNLDVTFIAKAMSDFRYRGVTYSAHRPSVFATVDVQLDRLYVFSEVYRVKLPTDPIAEVVVGAGFRPNVGPFDLDLGLFYAFFPGEKPVGLTTNTAYWEAYGRASHKLNPSVTIAGELAYSPSISNSGAWAAYTAGNIKIVLPNVLLPKDVSWSLSADLGHHLFGTVAPIFGGYRLPNYTNWRVGLAFAYDIFTLDFSYHDTNLSKEDCFVFTGDLSATPGGRLNPVSNPQGLRSNWCGAAFVATLSFELKSKK